MLFEKYRPKSLKEVVGNYRNIEDVRRWIRDWKKSDALLLYGPTGCGKSLAMELLAKELNYEMVESHASDYRRYEDIVSLLEKTKQQSLFYRGKIVVVDDLDIFESSRGIIELIKNSSCPVVLIAMDAYEKNLREIRKRCRIMKFDRIPHDVIAEFLKSVCQKEGIPYEEPAINQLAKMCNGDIRSALIDMEMLPAVSLKALYSLGFREKGDDIFNTLKVIFKSSDIRNVLTALGNSEKPLEDVVMWLEENIPVEYGDAEEIARAYDYLSRADIFSARIIRRQSFSLGKYSVLSALGVALSKKNRHDKFTMYRPPRMFFRNDRGDIKEKISKKLHISEREASECVYLVRMVMNEALARKFGFSEEDMERLEPNV